MLQAEIIGNLGGDAVIKEFNGKKYVSFSVAHNETDKNGQKSSVWVSVLWHGEGGKLMTYLVKGTQVFVRGKLRAGLFQDKNGQTQISLNMNAGEVQLCGGGRQDGTTASPNPNAPQEPNRDVAPSGEGNDLPF